MKKNFKKKLGLNKKTIANLERTSMENILGGGLTNETCTCPQSCIYPCLPNTDPIQCPYTAWGCTIHAEECITQQST